MCAAFVLALFGTISPYWVWSYSWVVGTVTSTVGTGTFVVSASSNAYRCGWWTTCIVSKQWNDFSDFNNTACTGDFYDEFGHYGFCDEDDGDFQRPPKISAIQGLAICTTVFLFCGTILSCMAPRVGGSKTGFAAAACSFIALATSCSAFAVATSFDWYQDLRSGNAALPFIASGGCDAGQCLFLDNTSNFGMVWGPAYWSFVTVFIITFFTTISACSTSRQLDNDDILEGPYGAGGQEPPPQYAEASQDYGYGAPATA